MITKAEATVLSELRAKGYIDNEIPFRPRLLWPERGNVDTAKWECVYRMVNDGLFVATPNQKYHYTPRREACISALIEYRNAHPDWSAETEIGD